MDLEQLIIARIANLETKINNIGEEKRKYQEDVEKVICAITKDEERLNELLDEKVKCLIRSLKLKESERRFTSLINVNKIDTALKNIKTIQEDEAINSLLTDVMDEINAVDVPTFVKYAEKMADESEIQQLFGEITHGSVIISEVQPGYTEQSKQHRYGCPTCLSVIISKVQPGDLTTTYEFKCSMCKTDIETNEKPLEYTSPKYNFYCNKCKVTITLRLRPKSEMIDLKESDKYIYDPMIPIRGTTMCEKQPYLNLKVCERKHQAREYSLTCECEKVLTNIECLRELPGAYPPEPVGEIDSYFREFPVLSPDYRYNCTNCKKTITTEEKPLVKEKWLMKKSLIKCNLCGVEKECNYLGAAE